MNNRDLLKFICRENNKGVISYIIRDDILIFSKYINKKILEDRNIDKNKSIFIRPMPILTSKNTTLTEDEYEYLELIYSLSVRPKYCDTISEDIEIYTREYLVKSKVRKNQNKLIYDANSKFLHNYNFREIVYERLLDNKMYWKRAKVNYRFILPDFVNNYYGTCLDTSLIVSSYFDFKGVYNFIINIRGKKGGHSITIIPSLEKIVSNFVLTDINTLREYINNFDIDSIIVKGKEFFFEDIENDLDLNKALDYLREHDKYRFYYSSKKISVCSDVIDRYLTEKK